MDQKNIRKQTRQMKSPNYWKENLKPKAIVLHVGGGIYSAIHNTIMNPESNASYHWVFKKDEIGLIEYVDPNYMAWHAGKVVKPTWRGLKVDLNGNWVNPNTYTLSVCRATYAEMPMSFKDYLNYALAVAKFHKISGLEINENTVVFHREIISTKSCPGMNVNKNTIIILAKLLSLV